MEQVNTLMQDNVVDYVGLRILVKQLKLSLNSYSVCLVRSSAERVEVVAAELRISELMITV